MSYDLQIWSVREFDPTVLRKPELLQHPIESHWKREGASWQISIFRSSKVLPEDVPTEIAQALPGIQFLIDMSIEGRGTAEAEKLLKACANEVAKALHGVIFDPQEDTIRTAAGIKRFALPPKLESFSVLRLSWWFLKSPLLSRDGLESFLSMIERLLPEAMPRRYGLYEPPQHIFAETGKAHLLQFMSEHAHEMVVWYPNRPVASFHLGQPQTVGATRLGFRTNVLDIEVESVALSQPGWPSNLRLLWRSVSTVLNPIYGEVRTHHGYRRHGGAIFPSMKDDLDVTASWWWRGTPKRLGTAVVLGAEYQVLWPDFLSHAALENDLAFASQEDWNSPKDLSDEIGAPPRQISHRGASAYGGDQEYPEVWPFEEPFNPPKPPSRGTFMSKLGSVFGIGMSVALLFCAPALCAQNKNAQATYTLKATPKTVAWGYYDAKAEPVLRVKSGDTVSIETLLTNSPKGLEKAGLPPDQVEQSLRDIYDQVKDKGPGGHILTGPIYIEDAQPGDVLEVKILGIKLAIPYAYNAFGPGRGYIPDDYPYAKMKIIPLDAQRMIAKFAPGVEIPLHPFFGSMGDAPPESAGRFNSAPPWIMAGNLDNKDLVAGTTLYIPVHAPGALFEVGDGHAGQGDGEVDITALETSLVGTFQFIVRKDMHLKWPRAETPTHYITMGLNDDLNACATLAVREMIDFLVTEKHLSRDDAYMLASVAADLHITELVDGNKGVHMMIPKSIFVSGSPK